MERLWALLLLLPLLPFIGVKGRARGIVFSFLLGAVGLLTSAAVSDSLALRLSLVCQLPLLGLLSGVVYGIYMKENTLISDSSLTGSKETLSSLQERHAALKEAVAKEDQEEARSLQIYGVAKALAESLSWKEMAPRLATGLQKLFGAYEFLLYAVDPEGNWNLLQRRGYWAKEPPLSCGPPSESTLIYPPQVPETVPVLTVPIHSRSGEDNRINGMLFLKSSDRTKTSEELVQTGRDFGAQLGVALNKALLFNQMEIHSRYDGLTGALRRQPFMDRLNEELKRAAVFHTPFSLMMVDIDYFKKVNDFHGHAAGDAVLKRVGQILKESVYETDIVGRYGGEEFVLLLPRAEAEGVYRKAEALRSRFEREVIASGFENIKITVSIGLAHFPKSGKSAQSLIESADRALYEAKESGRNRVVAA